MNYEIANTNFDQSAHDDAWQADLCQHNTLTTEQEFFMELHGRLTAKLCETHNAKKGKTAMTEVKSLEQRLENLEARIRAHQFTLEDLERRVLTKVPVTQNEATDMLMFLAGLIRKGKSMDAAYLSDTITDCLEAIGSKELKEIAA